MSKLIKDRIRLTVYKFIAEELDIESETLNGDISMQSDLGVDSLGMINIILAIENEYAITKE